MKYNKVLKSHLESRYFDLSRYNGVYISNDDYVITFSLWNLSGQMVGLQQYRPFADKIKKNHPREGRYYTSIHGHSNEKPLGVWGLESFNYRFDMLVICEGVFDACRFHNHNIPAIAVLGSSWKHYRNWITSLGRKNYKAEDDHGSDLGPFESIILPFNRPDIGECDEYEIKNIINSIIT